MAKPTSIIAALLCAQVQLASATTFFAHFMMQNAYAYDQNQWMLDIQSAQQMGVDGFALNWLPPNCGPHDLSWQVARMDDAYAVASFMNFKLFLSFDMGHTVCDKFWNQTYMASTILRYAGSAATYRWNSNILVSTFGGDAAPYGNKFFQDLKNLIGSWGSAITLSPALTSYSYAAQKTPAASAQKLMSDYPSIDGYMNWQAWPLDTFKNVSTVPDQAFQNQLRTSGRTGPYILSASPWQYKDLDNNNVQDAWVQYSDYLFPQRWQGLVGPNGFKPDIVEILTWNDWTESHYLRQLPSQDPKSTDYVELGNQREYVFSMNHNPWRIIAQYYISWMKSGSPPPITMDQIVFWYRIHPKSATCLAGSSTPIRNNMLPVDAVFVWALVTKPSTISTSVGTNKYYMVRADPSGPSMNMVPFPPEVYTGGDAYPESAVMRNGQVVAFNRGSKRITANCGYQNFNAHVVLAGPDFPTAEPACTP